MNFIHEVAFRFVVFLLLRLEYFCASQYVASGGSEPSKKRFRNVFVAKIFYADTHMF